MTAIEKLQQEKSQVQVWYLFNGKVYTTNLWAYVMEFADSTTGKKGNCHVWQWRDGELWKVRNSGETLIGSDVDATEYWQKIYDSCFGLAPSEFTDGQEFFRWMEETYPQAYADYLDELEAKRIKEQHAVRIDKTAELYADLIQTIPGESYKETCQRLKLAVNDVVEKEVFHAAVAKVRARKI